MSLTPIRPGRRRTQAQLRHIAALSDLRSRADRIRYACDQLAATGRPIAPQLVRTWLAEHDMPEDPDDTRGRSYVSRTVNHWRNDHEPAAPATIAAAEQTGSESGPRAPGDRPDGRSGEPRQDDPTTPAVHVHSTRAGASTPTPTVHTSGPETVHTNPTQDRHAARATDPARPPQVHAGVHADTAPGVHTGGAETHAGASTSVVSLVRRARRLRLASYLVLSAVAAAGAVLSYKSLRDRSAQVFPDELAAVFPLLVDALIVGASLAYLAGAVLGRGRPGWRLTAHAGVAGTLVLNALASPTLADVPWHIAAPLVWSALVELTARDLLGDYRAQHARPDSIPFALWLTAPGESASTWLRVRRQAAHASVRVDVGAHAAAREALQMALPGRRARRVRRIISRQLRAGSVTPTAVLTQAIAIMRDVPTASPQAVLRDVLGNAVGVTTGLESPPVASRPSVGRDLLGPRLVKARPRDIARLRAALRGEIGPGSEIPSATYLMRAAQPSQHRPRPAPSRPTKNPYIDLTAEPEDQSGSPTQEPISSTHQKAETTPTQKADTSTQPITEGIPKKAQNQTTPMHHGSSRPTKIH